MYFPGKDRLAFVIEHRGVVLAFTMSCFVFFVWLDLILYQCILDIPPAFPNPNATSATPHRISPFSDLSVKIMMMDPVNHYVHTYSAQIFNHITNFSTTFSFISPHLISFCGFLFALAAARCILSNNPSVHLLAVVLLQIRCWFDAFDGIVARDRLGLVKVVSVKHSLGHAVDGTADTMGYAAFLIATFFYFNRTVPKQRQCVKDVENDRRLVATTWTAHKIFKVCFLFVIQLIVSALCLNRYIEEYDLVLESTPKNQALAISQNEMLKKPHTLLVVWIWRYLGSHSLMQWYMVAVLLNRHWDFHVFVQHIGLVVIFTGLIITEIHLRYIKSVLEIT